MYKTISAAILTFALLVSTATAQDFPDDEKLANGEYPVAPYTPSNENAGATPISNPSVLEAFNGPEGVQRIVERLVDGMETDPRTADAMRASDFIRLRRTLAEQFIYILGAEGADYSGRDMATAHRDHGITTLEFNAVVEILQGAMEAEGVPFRMQNKFLARLAPMHRDVVTR